MLMMQFVDIASMTNTAIPFVQSASYPIRPGNLVRPLIDGEPAFRRICETIEAAQKSVWLTVTFMWSNFEMPDGRGCTLDVLDRAAARGIDVRVIFWRPDVKTEGLKLRAALERSERAIGGAWPLGNGERSQPAVSNTGSH